MKNKEMKKCNHCSCNEKDKSLKAFCPIHSSPTKPEPKICKQHERNSSRPQIPCPNCIKPDPEEWNYKICSTRNSEEWEKEFYNKFYKGIAIINYEPEHEDYQSLSLIEIEDFVRQEKEKSYKSGKHEGTAYGVLEGRHSAYREIIGELKQIVKLDKETMGNNIYNLISKLKERIK